MDSGLYAACTALMARSEALDLVANNLANASTSGYRAQHNTFRSLLASSSGKPLSVLNEATNDYGVLGGSRVDLSQGGMERTGNELDFGIEGSGFFVVQTPAGRVFTRNGSFQVSRQGQLITSSGDPVMGDTGAIQVIGGPVSVSSDGTISVNGAAAGKLKLVEFPAGTPLQSIGSAYYSAPSGLDTAATNAHVHQGMLEASNVNAVQSAVELVTLQRYAELMQRALSTFHKDFDKTAADELPRVNS
jgi:flagellar basal-body rod protein FlgF